MKTSLILTGLWLIGASAANAQELKVTAQNLTGWTLTGAEKSTLPASAGLTLPAGAQVARTFSQAELVVSVVTQPVFPEGTADWPALEVGAAAVLFSRSEQGGQLTVVAGENPPVMLGSVIKLDGDGRSLRPISLQVKKTGRALLVSTGGEVVAVDAGPTAGVDVVASAGADHAWSLERLEVTFPADPGAARVGSHTAGGESEDGLRIGPGTASSDANAIGAETAGGGASQAPAAKKATPAEAPGAGVLEIYTPPSIRLGRVDAVRAAFGNKKSN